MNTNVKFIILLAVTALISSLPAFFSRDANAAGLGVSVAIGLAASLTQLMAVWYFLSSLKAFKRGLRTAYYWLAVGIFVFCIGAGVLSALKLLVPSLSVFVMTPYALGALCMYIGMRKFAKLLDASSRWSSIWLVLACSAAAVGVMTLVPHPQVTETELAFDVTFGSLAWSGVLGVAGMLVALHIRQIIGPVYRKAIMWTALALGALTIASFQEVIVKAYFLQSSYSTYFIGLIWYLLMGVLFLRAGLILKQTGRETVQLPANASHVDIVVGVAQMVSRPLEINKALDEMRRITAKHLQTSQELPAADKATLTDLYLYLEDYLLVKEPLRKFTKEGLRNGLPEAFVQSLLTHKPGKAFVRSSAA